MRSAWLVVTLVVGCSGGTSPSSAQQAPLAPAEPTPASVQSSPSSPPPLPKGPEVTWVETLGKAGEKLLEPAQQCDQGDEVACAMLAKSRLNDETGDAHAVELLVRTCNADGAHACRFLASHHLPDWAKAAPLYRKACELDDAISCRDLGITIPDLVSGDNAERKKLLVKACEVATAPDAGDLCSYAAQFARHGHWGTKEPAVAHELYGRACSRGHTYSCGMQTMLEVNGEGVPKNTDGALAKLAPFCDWKAQGRVQHHADICRAYAALLVDAGDLDAADRTYWALCPGPKEDKLYASDHESCVARGSFLLKHRPKAKKLARELFVWSCHHRQESACKLAKMKMPPLPEPVH